MQYLHKHTQTSLSCPLSLQLIMTHAGAPPRMMVATCKSRHTGAEERPPGLAPRTRRARSIQTLPVACCTPVVAGVPVVGHRLGAASRSAHPAVKNFRRGSLHTTHRERARVSASAACTMSSLPPCPACHCPHCALVKSHLVYNPVVLSGMLSQHEQSRHGKREHLGGSARLGKLLQEDDTCIPCTGPTDCLHQGQRAVGNIVADDE